MKNLVAISALIGGLLLIFVPRYILPACEYEGFARMHCSDTARAEYVAGLVLIVIGAATFFSTRQVLSIVSVVVAGIVYGVAFWLPDKFGYCLSPRMPCHYGMVPGIRFIAVTGALLMVIGFIGLTRSYRKKGNA